MGIFGRFFGGGGPWTLDGVTRPWGDRPSLHAHLVAHLDPLTGILAEAGQKLPDEPAEDANQLRWVAGGLDGVMSHHAGPSREELRVRQIVAALEKLMEAATAGHLEHLHRLVVRDGVLGVVDGVLEALVDKQGRIDPERLAAIGRMLATEAADREAVKFGISLLGLVGSEDDRELLMTLGSHEELTLYAAVALKGASFERALWELAQRVDGWGRIELVERLSETDDSEIRAWLLRDGYKNQIMDEYLAHTCAMAGRLHEALAATQVDDALLLGASGILAALARGGPAPDLEDYPHAADAIRAWLAHLERRPLTLHHVEALDDVATRSEVPSDLRPRLERLRSSDAALALIEAGLDSNDAAIFGRADQAARRRRIDVFARHLARVRRGTPQDVGYSLYRLMCEADEARVEHALAAARERIDLGSVATGPESSLGLGPEFVTHGLLDYVLQELGRFPGRGADFITAGLRSPVVRNRNMAVRALHGWTPARWPRDLARALEESLGVEPEADTRARMQRVVDGGPFDDPEEPEDDIA